MMPVLGTTAGKTGIVTATEIEIEIEIETWTGTGIGGTINDGQTTSGHPEETIVQPVPARIEENMCLGKVNGAVGMTTEETGTETETGTGTETGNGNGKGKGNGGGVGTVTINGPAIANMTDDLLPRAIVLHHYHRGVVSPLLTILAYMCII